MDDPGRIELRHWANFDQNHLRDYFRDHPALKLMDVLAERDAAFAERDTAIAEKKTAYAERDAALLQRDVAFADRNSAWMERDSAVAALTVVRGRKDHNEANGRLMQMVNFAVSCPPMESNLLTYPRPANVYENFIEAKPLAKQMKQQGKKTTDSSKKRKSSGMNDHDNKPPKSSPKKKRNKKAQPETSMRMDIMNQVDFLDNRHVAAAAPYDISSTPIPYCSCTGASQQCYRWGKGGWQSACCTKYTSMYPLPMNPAKRGSRIAGRKMSGGAFKKLLERLLGEGVDIREPIDLKDHWAKHGTNKYVTIK